MLSATLMKPRCICSSAFPKTPPFWQIGLALALSGLTTLGVVKLSAKIYRVGILMYGKRPSLIELMRWLRYT